MSRFVPIRFFTNVVGNIKYIYIERSDGSIFELGWNAEGTRLEWHLLPDVPQNIVDTSGNTFKQLTH